jgi:transposase
MSKRFNKDFKHHAINLVLNEGQSKRYVSRNLDIGLSTLDRWIRLSKLGKLSNFSSNKISESEELNRLRKENSILRQEREILKKAAAFFAREQP